MLFRSNAIFAYQGEARYNQICKALTYYSQLTDSEKAEVEQEYDTIFLEVNAYNNNVEALNNDMDSTSATIIYCVVATNVLLAAAYVIGKRIF